MLLINTTEEEIESADKISYSEITMFTRDKRAWYYQYVLGLTSPATPSYFSKGTYLHEVAAGLLLGEDQSTLHGKVLAKMEEEGRGEVEEVEANRLFQEALRTTAQVKEQFEVLDVEKEFYWNTGLTNWKGDPILLHGFMDAIMEDEKGLKWILEHKTAGRAWSDGQFLHNFQDSLYASSLYAEEGTLPKGGLYFFYLPKRTDHRTRHYSLGMLNYAMSQLQAVAVARDELTQFPIESQWGTPFSTVFEIEIGGGDAEYLLKTQFVVDEERLERAKRFRKWHHDRS